MTPDPRDQDIQTSPAEDTPFTYGDGTVMQLRSQAFTIEEEFGTIVSSLPATDVALPIALPMETISEDPLLRLERKVDAALRQLERLQQRIESLDMTVARVLSR